MSIGAPASRRPSASTRTSSTARCARGAWTTSSASRAEGAARGLDRGRDRARRGARPRPARRPARPRQDVARADHRRRARRRRSCRPPARRSSARATSPPSSPRSSRAASSSSTRSTGCQRALEETFYPAMEDRQLPITVGLGAGARVVTLDLPPFTLDRRDDPHRPADDAAARPLRHPAPPRALRHRRPRDDRRALGADPRRRARARGRARDRGAQPRHAARGQPPAQARARLRGGPRRRDRLAPRPPTPRSSCWRSTTLGLDRLDRELLRALCESFGGGPVGLSTLAVAVGEEQDTIEDVYEPYLLQRGLLERTPRGRAATPRAYAHLGLEPPADAPDACSESAPAELV